MKNLDPIKTITIAGLIAAIGGLISNFLPSLVLQNGRPFPDWAVVFMGLFKPVYLSFFDRGMVQLPVGGGTTIGINIIDVLFYVLFVIGAILFAVKKFESPRIVAFCFSIVFFIQSTGIIFFVYRIISRFTSAEQDVRAIPFGWMMFYLVADLAWLYLSFYVLKHVGKHRAPEVMEYEDKGEIRGLYITAGKGKRFVHSLIDRIMITFICSTWTYVFSSMTDIIERKYPSEEAFLIYYISCTLVYYLFFEGLLGITPAKLLTGTQVTDESGNKPRFGNILGRTLSRFIPFDALSFLFARGWHDSISDTYVLNNGPVQETDHFSFEKPKNEEAAT
jgi:uncharacterized RDD family membrane protein YckC